MGVIHAGNIIRRSHWHLKRDHCVAIHVDAGVYATALAQTTGYFLARIYTAWPHPGFRTRNMLMRV